MARSPSRGWDVSPSVRLLLEPLWALAHERRTWSPRLFPRVVWCALHSIGSHREILRVLTFPEFGELTRDYPRFAFKCLMQDYLARGFTVKARASSFINHYSWLHEKLPSAFVERLLREKVPLVVIHHSLNVFTIDCAFAGFVDKEGELELRLNVGDERVFTLSFTVVPGWVVKSKAQNVLLISRLHGVKGNAIQMRLVYRTMHGAGPSAVLLTALQGIGNATGIDTLACIAAANQPAYREARAASFHDVYDRLFETRGICMNAADVFLSPIPMEEKPLSQFRRSLRQRALNRRELKRILSEAVCRAFSDIDGGDLSPKQILLEPAPRIV